MGMSPPAEAYTKDGLFWFKNKIVVPEELKVRVLACAMITNLPVISAHGRQLILSNAPFGGLTLPKTARNMWSPVTRVPETRVAGLEHGVC